MSSEAWRGGFFKCGGSSPGETRGSARGRIFRGRLRSPFACRHQQDLQHALGGPRLQPSEPESFLCGGGYTLGGGSVGGVG